MRRNTPHLHPSFRFSCKNITMSKCPEVAALSMAVSVHLFPCSCSQRTSSRYPFNAAPCMARIVHPSDRFSWSHRTTSK